MIPEIVLFIWNVEKKKKKRKDEQKKKIARRAIPKYNNLFKAEQTVWNLFLFRNTNVWKF